MCDFLNLSIEICIKLFFLPFINFVVFPFVLKIFLLILLLLSAIIRVSLHFFVYYSRLSVVTSIQSSMMVSPLPPSFLNTKSLSINIVFGYKAMYLIIIFFVLWFIKVPPAFIQLFVVVVVVHFYSDLLEKRHLYLGDHLLLF